MTATNHALTGAIIGLAVGNPAIAIPAAFVSHFVCDALPHYGSAEPAPKLLKTNGFRNYLLVEAALCGLLVVTLALARPAHWWVAAICAFAAASPDFFWINKYLTMRAGRVWHPNRFSRFARDIQWFQRPLGAVVEAVWFAAAIAILAAYLR